jgi:hypothetical protein
MTALDMEFLPLDRHSLFPHSVGEILAKFARRKWPRDTTKHVSREWGVDPRTAANLIKGHSSERTISTALRAEGWPLFMALGEAMTGEAYSDFLQGVADAHERQRKRAEAHKDTIRSLEARASELVGIFDRRVA